MPNEITFKFKSDAPWSEKELKSLFETFLEEVKTTDDDFVKDSASINLVDEEATDSAIRDAAIELIANSLLAVSVELQDKKTGEELYKNSFDADAV